MKKTYIAPKTEMMEVAVESLLAASISVDQSGSIESEDNFLSNESSEWSSDCWSE